MIKHLEKLLHVSELFEIFRSILKKKKQIRLQQMFTGEIQGCLIKDLISFVSSNCLFFVFLLSVVPPARSSILLEINRRTKRD